MFSYRNLMILISLISVGLLYITGSQFTYIIDLATSLSFLTAPALAYINYKLITSDQLDEEFKPKKWLIALSWIGLIFLTAFALVFFYWRFFV
ncbi:MAG: hypothetical protein GWN00_14335 [Aliifodinibius sp.]|nr:hypothetical protein [Fodinibius sp.]NIW45162.1 hypothetical protein [Gammaproteobacteria bacterium]NIY25940.1 hypothetical protein [Fodinibius sp.]